MNDCNERWPGRKDRDGYPIVRIGNQYRTVARLMYELFIGPIPFGHCVRHSCDNRACINPSHLLTGTQADNMADKKARQRQPRGMASIACRYDDNVITAIRRGDCSVAVARLLHGMSKSQYYRIVRGDSR